MEKVQIFWDPVGFELGSRATTTISGDPTSGDTPCVHTSIRMLSIDTPEIHYPLGNTSLSNHHRRLEEHVGWIQPGLTPTNDDFAACLISKISTGSVGTPQKGPGEAVKDHFAQRLNEKHTKSLMAGSDQFI